MLARCFCPSWNSCKTAYTPIRQVLEVFNIESRHPFNFFHVVEILACDQSSADTLLHAAQLLSCDLQTSSTRYGAGDTGVNALLQHAHDAIA